MTYILTPSGVEDIDAQAYFLDDFIGSSDSSSFEDDTWASLAVGFGSSVQVVVGRGGVLRIQAGAANGRYGALYFIQGVTNKDSNATLKFRGALSASTNLLMSLGLWEATAQHSAYFLVNNTSGNWQAYTYGGTATTTVTNVPLDTSNHIFSIKMASTQVEFFIDNILVATHNINLPVNLVKPDFYVQNTAGGSNRWLDLDFVELIMDRAS